MCATTDASVGKCKSLYKSDFEAFFRQLAFPIVRKRVEKMLRMLLSSNGRRDNLSQTEKFAAKPPAKLWSSWRQPMEYMLKEQRLIFVVLGMAIASAFFLLQTEFLLSDQMISEQDSPSIIVGRGVVVPEEPGIRRDNSIQVRRRSTTVVPKQSSFTAKMPLGLKRKVLRVVVTGGAGFVGSHLVDKLMARGDHVIVVDNFFTGRKENVMHHFGNHRFELIRHDVVEPLLLEVDQIYHLACPASPVHYKHNPVKTIHPDGKRPLVKFGMLPKVQQNAPDVQNLLNVVGTLNMLGLAKRVGARFLLTSTSEVYGDPLQHPQKEDYWGNVNPIGVRSCYDEGKRTAETLTMDYHRGADVQVRIARIFNTYGPRMCIDDGRVVSNFVSQALRKEPMTVYGDGKQTRSFQYISDLVEGLLRLMEGEHVGPFNLGNPSEFTMLELAEVVKEVLDPAATIEFCKNTADDPHMRKPDISKAKDLLGWEPKVALRKGLSRMVEDFRQRILNDHNEGSENSSARYLISSPSKESSLLA